MAAYSYPVTAVEDTGGPQRLHPDYVKDSLKLCMYKAIAGVALGNAQEFKTVVNVTKPLRTTFMVPFDDDVWAVVLAYVFDLRYLGNYDSLAAAELACKSAKNGDRLYISIGAVDPTDSGHAIYAVKTDKVSYHDNEYASDTTKINPKFNSGFRFLIFKRTGLADGSARSLAYRIAYMPATMVQTLLQAHVSYGHFTVGLQRADSVSADTLKKRFENRTTKMKWTLKSKDSLDRDITAWDRAMPTT